MRVRAPQSTNKSSRCGIHFALACVGILGIAQNASAQTSGPILPEIEAPAEIVEPGSQTSPPAYWIASSRRCAQRFQTRCPNGTLDYFAVDGNETLSPVSEQGFLSSLHYDQPICFIVHGDLTSFQDVRRSAPRIVKWITGGAPNQNVQFVFYTWPSDDELNPLPELDISARGERAEFNACYLAKLITMFPKNTRISFFGHSFGTRITSATMHLLAGGAIPACGFRCPEGQNRQYRAVFAAAAIDRTWLNPRQRYGRALCLMEWLLNMKNGADFVINLYPLRSIFGPQALGRFGFSPRDRLQMGKLSRRVNEWDVTLGVGPRHGWSHYYTRPEIAKVIAPILSFTATPPHQLTAKPVPSSPQGNLSHRLPKPVPSKRPATRKPKAIFRDSTRTEPENSRQTR